jgi:predicted amidohydrolase
VRCGARGDRRGFAEVIAVVGAPLQADHLLYNCAAVVANGRILGVIPKTYLPNYQEFYEQRYLIPPMRRRGARSNSRAKVACRSATACCFSLASSRC